MATDKTELTVDVSPDYEAEWNRQRVEIMKLKDENKKLRNTIVGMCKALYAKEGAIHNDRRTD